MSPRTYDVVIIGAGPAGIQAAIHAARKKTDVLVLGRPENSALYWAHVENYAFVEGVREGKDMLDVGHRQMEKFGARKTGEDVLKISREEDSFHLELESGSHIEAATLIFAMGVSKKKLSVPGEKELAGRGVSYCVDCDANFYRGATVAVVGDRSAAVDGALTLLGYADKVYLVAKELNVSEELLARLEKSNVEVLGKTWVRSIDGEKNVTGITLENDKEIAVDGVFIELGSKGALELATQLGVELDTEQFKYIKTNRKQETNIAGVYAAGDIVGPPYQMAKAVGEGCVAGMEAAALARKLKKQDSP
ncbi:MAG: NAD(P)/FAD-dependent oxidoreductase [Desulfobulbaceae bacterium]|nr:NAD(P)/FAD-dependent oxidoreductase [Desulfobulbaceae bacterium]